MSDSKDLAIVKIGAIPAVIFSPDTVELGKLLDKYSVEKIPTDLTVKENYDFVADGKKAHLKCRQKITDDHKDLKKPFRDGGLQLDNAKNSMLKTAKPVEDAYIKSKKDYDNIEKIRLEAIEKAKQEAIDAIFKKISWIGQYASRLISKPASDVKVAIDDLNNEKFDWCDEFIDSAENTVASVIEQLESMHKLKVENENAESLAEEKRLEREAEDKKREEERVIDQKRIDAERAEMEAERAKLQADKDAIQAEKDKLEREKLEAQTELDQMKAEKLAEDERIKEEEDEAKLKAEQDKVAEENRFKVEASAKAHAEAVKKEEAKEAQKVKKDLAKREKETLKALTLILRSDKPASALASELLAKIEDGTVPHLFFK